MGLETGSFIEDLDIANPAATDNRTQGDDHLRLIKILLKATFPGMTGAAWRVQTKAAGYTVVAGDNMSIFSCSAAITLALTAVATIGNKFACVVYANGADVVIDPNGAETINGVPTLTLVNGQAVILVSTGALWFAFGLPLPNLGTIGQSLGASTIELGHASDTTITRVSAGVVAVEGKTVAMLSAAETFTAPQRGTITTDNDASFDQSVTNNFFCTPSVGAALTFTNHTAGQSGLILFVNGSNYAITAAATTYISAADLAKLSATGTYLIAYLDNGTNAYCTVTAALTSAGA